MTWWLCRSKRLDSEKASLADLEGSVDWLQVDKWQANTELAMCVDFRIVLGEAEFAFQMIYPSMFPDAPPMVYTADRSSISLHQYGAEGELCLEHRPDNWQPLITGADMVASCQRLLVEERPDVGEIVHARSAHIASLGRDLRPKNYRLLITEADIVALNALTECTSEPLALCERRVDATYISSIQYVGAKDAPVWTSDLVMPKGGIDYTGFAVRVPGTEKQGIIKPDDLRTLLDGVGLQDLGKSLCESDTIIQLLIGDRNDWELFWFYGEAKMRKIIAYTTVHIPNERRRLPDGFERLSEKRVSIVGCGSLGSKIAASLCRSGIRNFLLVDGDIFFPGNKVRNELDLRATGFHKSHALRDRLLNIAPAADVKALRITLGGQESAASMAGVLEALGNCDLLVDATADSTAFNMIASVSTRKKKPMVWAEVFSGGIGGFVARARPNLDPVPLSARRQITTWCNDHGVERVRTGDSGRYDGQSDDGHPLIADDAEVALIASHATRFASDILARHEASIFPVSAYVVGFSSEWLFEQPFDTYPIDLRPDGIWGEVNDSLNPEDLLKLLNEHLPPKENWNAAAIAE